MKWLASLALLLTGCVAVNRQPNTDILYGSRSIPNDPGGTSIGMQFNYAGTNSIGPELGVIVTQDDGTDMHSVETSFGLRKSFLFNDVFQLYASTGVAIRNPSDEDAAMYGQAGLNWFLDQHYTAGIMLRRSFWDDEETFVMFGLGYSF